MSADALGEGVDRKSFPALHACTAFPDGGELQPALHHRSAAAFFLQQHLCQCPAKHGGQEGEMLNVVFIVAQWSFATPGALLKRPDWISKIPPVLQPSRWPYSRTAAKQAAR